MSNKIELALDFLKDGQTATVGDLRFELETKDIFVVIGWSNYLNLNNLTRAIATEELFEIKTVFSNMLDSSQQLKKFITGKLIRYSLCFDDGGKASIDICSEINGMITWSINLK